MADVVESSPGATFRVEVPRRGPDLQFRTALGFEWMQLTVRIPRLHAALDGFRALHVTDLHCRSSWDPAYDVLIGKLADDPPDVLLFTGDFVESKRDHRPALGVVRKLFTSLRSRLGTFAILGNHDGDLLAPQISKWNVTLIDHRRVVLEQACASVELIGLPGVERNDLDPAWVRGLGRKPAGTLRIALSHYPDTVSRIAGLEPDVCLSGHTHGGQVALPGRRPIIRHDSLPGRLCTGVHIVSDTILVVNRGLGFSSPLPLRLFCPAEVIDIRFMAG